MIVNFYLSDDTACIEEPGDAGWVVTYNPSKGVFLVWSNAEHKIDKQPYDFACTTLESVFDRVKLFT